MTSTVFAYFSAASALGAAFFWAKAAAAYVAAPPRDDDAIGPLMDGSVIIRAGKHRALLFETLELQSRWNGRGAAAAALSALLTGAAVLVDTCS